MSASSLPGSQGRKAKSKRFYLPAYAAVELSVAVWEKNRGKPVEICDTLQPSAWGYEKSTEGKHKTADDVMKMLADAKTQNANLLLNTGPLADGSIHPDDQATLREVGRRLHA